MNGVAVLQSRWPRVGLGEAHLVPDRCIGRFGADGDAWVLESSSSGTTAHGHGDPLGQLNRIIKELGCRHPDAGAVGYISYEAGYAWMNLDPPKMREDEFAIPQLQFLLFEELKSEDARRGPNVPTPERKAYSREHMLAMTQSDRFRPTVTREKYLAAVGQIQNHIRAGDIYQANYTQAFDIDTARPGVEIYRDLATANPAPFAAFLGFPALSCESQAGKQRRFPAIEVISNSPERLWRKTGDSIETRPIKGTIARGDTSEVDRSNRRRLLTSHKDRAELLMITDLERNDLGRFAEIGSVRVRALRRARAYSSIWHLESVVSARVDASVPWDHIMRCMFPGGSITGAPKYRAMEILRDLEPVDRGVYCGAIGWVNGSGDADFSIPIRTAVKIGSKVRVFGGGGIVADSDPESEYEESLVKIAPILEYLCR